MQPLLQEEKPHGRRPQVILKVREKILRQPAISLSFAMAPSICGAPTIEAKADDKVAANVPAKTRKKLMSMKPIISGESFKLCRSQEQPKKQASRMYPIVVQKMA